VEEALADLPPREREVWTLTIDEGLSPDQIAERLNTTRNNVDQALHRGRVKLREKLARG
jgi:RNA polymerase sigma factor (sigma-70 family)